jgi:hypothetical protein
MGASRPFPYDVSETEEARSRIKRGIIRKPKPDLRRIKIKPRPDGYKPIINSAEVVNQRRSWTRSELEAIRSQALRVCRAARNCRLLERTPSTESLLSSYSARSASVTDLRFTGGKPMAVGSKVGIVTLLKHPHAWTAYKAALGLTTVGLVSYGAVEGWRDLKAYLFGTATDPVNPELLKIVNQITDLLANATYTIDKNLQLEDGESRLERAVSALRFNVIQFDSAGDDIIEDIDKLLLAREEAIMGGRISFAALHVSIWETINATDSIDRSWNASSGAKAKYVKETDSLEIVIPADKSSGCQQTP